MSQPRFTPGRTIPTLGREVLDSANPDGGPVAHIHHQHAGKRNVLVLTEEGRAISALAPLANRGFADETAAFLALQLVAEMPETLGLVRDRIIKNGTPRHPRKVVEMCLLVQGATPADAADWLEAMAARLRDDDDVLDYVGSSGGKNVTGTWAAVRHLSSHAKA